MLTRKTRLVVKKSLKTKIKKANHHVNIVEIVDIILKSVNIKHLSAIFVQR